MRHARPTIATGSVALVEVEGVEMEVMGFGVEKVGSRNGAIVFGI